MDIRREDNLYDVEIIISQHWHTKSDANKIWLTKYDRMPNAFILSYVIKTNDSCLHSDDISMSKVSLQEVCLVGWRRTPPYQPNLSRQLWQYQRLTYHFQMLKWICTFPSHLWTLYWTCLTLTRPFLLLLSPYYVGISLRREESIMISKLSHTNLST